MQSYPDLGGGYSTKLACQSTMSEFYGPNLSGNHSCKVLKKTFAVIIMMSATMMDVEIGECI